MKTSGFETMKKSHPMTRIQSAPCQEAGPGRSRARNRESAVTNMSGAGSGVYGTGEGTAAADRGHRSEHSERADKRSSVVRIQILQSADPLAEVGDAAAG